MFLSILEHWELGKTVNFGCGHKNTYFYSLNPKYAYEWHLGALGKTILKT